MHTCQTARAGLPGAAGQRMPGRNAPLAALRSRSGWDETERSQRLFGGSESPTSRMRHRAPGGNQGHCLARSAPAVESCSSQVRERVSSANPRADPVARANLLDQLVTALIGAHGIYRLYSSSARVIEPPSTQAVSD